MHEETLQTRLPGSIPVREADEAVSEAAAHVDLAVALDFDLRNKVLPSFSACCGPVVSHLHKLHTSAEGRWSRVSGRGCILHRVVCAEGLVRVHVILLEIYINHRAC